MATTILTTKNLQLTADIERKLPENLHKVVKESMKTDKISWMLLKGCELKIGDNKIKLVWKFKYLGCVLIEDGKCDEGVLEE